jgi:hypothetical protein
VIDAPERRSWRGKSLDIGFALMWVDIAYGVVVFLLQRMDLFSYGTIVSIGFLLGACTLICGLAGKGHGRWAVVPIAAVLTAWWWLMAVGG